MNNKRSVVINFLIRVCEKVTNAIIRDFYELEQLQVTRKNLGEFVTNADVKAEKLIIKELSWFKVDSNFLTEEHGEIINFPSEKSRWIIDGIDGTSNFMRGNPNFCTAIALEEENKDSIKEITAAIIYCHISKEVYWAEQGKGAYLINNGFEKKIKVASREKLSELVGSVNTVLSRHSDSESKICNKLIENHSRFRISGSTSIDMAYVASGKLDFCIHDNVRIWDVAAGSLITKEAGGLVTDFQGNDDVYHGSSMIVTNKLIHSQIKII